MGNYWIEAAMLDVGFMCDECGASGHFEAQAIEFCDGSVGVENPTCPECGAELEY
ncbi:MAG: hypothetical protein ACOCZ5_03035 [bacterium]